MYATGTGAGRDTGQAVRYASSVAQKGFAMGNVVNQALDSYLEDRIEQAATNYLVSAEAGFDLGQRNLIYLAKQEGRPFFGMSPERLSYHMTRLGAESRLPVAMTELAHLYCNFAQWCAPLTTLCRVWLAE